MTDVEAERAAWRRYLAWRKTLPSVALFLLACVETSLFLAAWVGGIVATTAIVLAPVWFGMPEGFFVWGAVYVLVIASATVMNRNGDHHPRKETGSE